MDNSARVEVRHKSSPMMDQPPQVQPSNIVGRQKPDLFVSRSTSLSTWFGKAGPERGGLVSMILVYQRGSSLVMIPMRRIMPHLSSVVCGVHRGLHRERNDSLSTIP